MEKEILSIRIIGFIKIGKRQRYGRGRTGYYLTINLSGE
jgi:hypothetical protein